MKISGKINSSITNSLLDAHIIEPQTRDIYSYCFDFVLDLIIFNLSILLIGLMLHIFPYALLYIIVLTPTKMLVGGAHAPSQGICSIISYLIAIIAFVISAVSKESSEKVWIILYIISCFAVIYMAPVEHPDKRFENTQKVKLKNTVFTI